MLSKTAKHIVLRECLLDLNEMVTRDLQAAAGVERLYRSLDFRPEQAAPPKYSLYLEKLQVAVEQLEAIGCHGEAGQLQFFIDQIHADEPDGNSFGLEALKEWCDTTIRDATTITASPVGNFVDSVTPADQGAAKYPTPDNFERDKWIYEQLLEKKTIPDIIHELESNQNKWYPLFSDNGIREAGRRYGKHIETPLPKGRPGKPRSR